MKRCLLALILAVAVTSPAAAQNAASTTQMKLVASSTFTARLQYLMVQYAAIVLNESHSFPTAACHNSRIQYAFAVLTSPAQMASNAAILISSSNAPGAVIVGTVITTGVEPDVIVDSSASDAAIATAIQNGWSVLAKCDTGT